MTTSLNKIGQKKKKQVVNFFFQLAFFGRRARLGGNPLSGDRQSLDVVAATLAALIEIGRLPHSTQQAVPEGCEGL